MVVFTYGNKSGKILVTGNPVWTSVMRLLGEPRMVYKDKRYEVSLKRMNDNYYAKYGHNFGTYNIQSVFSFKMKS